MQEVEIINQAIDKYHPSKVFALFSGGNDSVCASHIASQAKQFDGVVYIDTGIKVKKTLQHARDVAESFGWQFQIAPTPESYEDIVMKHGFPGPYAHKFMYVMLKERAIDKFIRETKSHWFDKIILIAGARKFESKRRMIKVISPIVENGARVWVAPMWQWTHEIKDAYMKDNDLPYNPVKDYLHVSGDCLCGSYNDKGDLEALKFVEPETAEYIIELQKKVMQKFPWGWEDQPPEWWKDYNNGQMFLGNDFMPLCWSCERAAEEINHVKKG